MPRKPRPVHSPAGSFAPCFGAVDEDPASRRLDGWIADEDEYSQLAQRLEEDGRVVLVLGGQSILSLSHAICGGGRYDVWTEAGSGLRARKKSARATTVSAFSALPAVSHAHSRYTQQIPVLIPVCLCNSQRHRKRLWTCS